MTSDESAQKLVHTVHGVAEGTNVWCPGSGQAYGPGGFSHYAYCPYCGEDTGDEDHTVDESIDEVHCPNTTMSTYRYCPSCGGETDAR